MRIRLGGDIRRCFLTVNTLRLVTLYIHNTYFVTFSSYNTKLGECQKFVLRPLSTTP